MITARILALALLPAFFVAAVFGLYVHSINNGTFEAITAVVDADFAFLSGTRESLIQKYTGIKALDRQLKVLVYFFWPIVDGSSPACTLFSLEFGAAFGAVWTVLVMESLRAGNRWQAVS
jgi:hypothetical protein